MTNKRTTVRSRQTEKYKRGKEGLKPGIESTLTIESTNEIRWWSSLSTCATPELWAVKQIIVAIEIQSRGNPGEAIVFTSKSRSQGY